MGQSPEAIERKDLHANDPAGAGTQGGSLKAWEHPLGRGTEDRGYHNADAQQQPRRSLL